MIFLSSDLINIQLTMRLMDNPLYYNIYYYVYVIVNSMIFGLLDGETDEGVRIRVKGL